MDGERAQDNIETAVRIRQGADISMLEPDLVEARCMVTGVCENGVVVVDGGDEYAPPKPPEYAGNRNGLITRPCREIEKLNCVPRPGTHHHRNQRPVDGSEAAEVAVDDPKVSQFAPQKHRVRIRHIHHFGLAVVKAPRRNP